jgi:hypothetical protein
MPKRKRGLGLTSDSAKAYNKKYWADGRDAKAQEYRKAKLEERSQNGE